MADPPISKKMLSPLLGFSRIEVISKILTDKAKMLSYSTVLVQYRTDPSQRGNQVAP